MRNRNNFYSLPSHIRYNFLKSADLKSIRCIGLYVLLLIFLNINQSFSQFKRVVAIGSSTTAGNGASSKDSAWVRLLSKYYKCQLGVADTIYNLGVPGSDNYWAMPTGYIPPPLRPSPDNEHNISKARFLLNDLSIASDGVIIINYPTNNYIDYTIEEIMSSLQLIHDSAISGGNRCFITTTQPRTDASFNTADVKRKLADIKDSIIKMYQISG